jgi:hypothetical protein
MKKLLMLLVAVSPIISMGQILPIDSETGEVVFTEVVSVTDSSTKAIDLFYRAQEFLVDAFKSADNVTQLANEESGKIIVKGNYEITAPRKVLGSIQNFSIGTVSFRLDLEVRDGRYRYSFSDFFHTTSTISGGNLKDELPDESVRLMTKDYGQDQLSNWDRIKIGTNTIITDLITRLKDKMDVTSEESEEDDW